MASYDYVWGNKTTETAKENTAFPTSTFSLALLKGTPYCTERLCPENLPDDDWQQSNQMAMHLVDEGQAALGSIILEGSLE